MGKIGVYIERNTINSSFEMNALMRFAQVARRMGHRSDFLFRPDIFKIKEYEYDAIFIRALTDPLNTAYVVARTAELHGIRVIDDSDSIYICCDKINMYRRLQKKKVPIPESRFLTRHDLTSENARVLLEELGTPVVLKAPNSSSSLFVDRAWSPKELIKIGKRYLHRADMIVAQKFIESKFDWRIGVLNGEVLYVCQYIIPGKKWKIMSYTAQGRLIYGPVRGFAINQVNPLLIRRAVQAANAIGKSFYGVDLKEVGDDFLIIEVNDNPTIMAGDEDQKSGDLYERLINYLLAATPNS
jgi:glutathione synthase/RimK-type ligase-like ATP-grasp enzyme